MRQSIKAKKLGALMAEVPIQPPMILASSGRYPITIDDLCDDPNWTNQK
jgi:hypothetical protein